MFQGDQAGVEGELDPGLADQPVIDAVAGLHEGGHQPGGAQAAEAVHGFGQEHAGTVAGGGNRGGGPGGAAADHTHVNMVTDWDAAGKADG